MNRDLLIGNVNVILATVLLATIVYLSLIVVLKIAGKRTFSVTNGFDLLIPVTLGPISATTILSKDISFLNGFVAILTLVIIQYFISRLNRKFSFIEKILISKALLLYYEKDFLIENMNKARVTRNDVERQVRLKAGTFIENIDAVILESNGEFSIIIKANAGDIKRLEEYR